MRRIVSVLAAAGLASVMLPPTASAQTPSTLTVVKDVFTDASGEPGDLFAQGTPIHARLTLRNAGNAPVTGIVGALTFERGRVITGTASWPDLAPSEQAANEEPFVFSWSEGPGEPDPDCFIIVDEDTRVDPDAIVTEPEANTAVRTDAGTDPSDPIEPIPPGSITWLISSDQGSIEHAIPFLAVCAAATQNEGPMRDTLAKTGALEPSLSVAGLLFIVGGTLLRRRAGAS